MTHPFGCEPNCNGELDVGAFSLNTWGWMVQNLARLWFDRTYVGENRRLPRQTGQVGYPHYRDAHDFSLVFWVTGAYEDDGTPYADWWEGLHANIALLNTNVFNPVTTGDGSRACTLTLPDASTQTASVQFEPLARNADIEDPFLVEFVMRGTILEGAFT